jgi:E3 ubiquitin-protein ligase SHPRH
MTQKGKGKERERFSDNENEDDDEDEESEPDGEVDPEEKDLPKTPAGEEHRIKRRAIKQRLREGQLVLHRVKFLQGDVFHVLGKSADEDAAYQAAETLRHELLKSPLSAPYILLLC